MPWLGTAKRLFQDRGFSPHPKEPDMKPKPPDPDASRLEEIEIKLAFMEKELEEYKEASRNFYKRMAGMEEEIRTLKREFPESSLPSPEVTWDSENQSVRN
jgi:uncharacterized coiled-coil protein SlyX